MNEIQITNNTQQEASLMVAINAAAENPAVDVEKMERLLAMHEKMTADAARRQFVTALHDFQTDCPQIHRSGGIVVGGQLRSRYAPYDSMMRTVRPYMQRHGFSESFDTLTNSQSVICAVVCTLSHVAGHSEKSTFPVAPDTSGSKNGIQAIGSALSYGKRYSLGAALGLVFSDEDDDGRATSKLQEVREEIAIKGKDSDADRDTLVESIGASMRMERIADDELNAALRAIKGEDLDDWTLLPLESLQRISTPKVWAMAKAKVAEMKGGAA